MYHRYSTHAKIPNAIPVYTCRRHHLKPILILPNISKAISYPTKNVRSQTPQAQPHPSMVRTTHVYSFWDHTLLCCFIKRLQFKLFANITNCYGFNQKRQASLFLSVSGGGQWLLWLSFDICLGLLLIYGYLSVTCEHRQVISMYGDITSYFRLFPILGYLCWI